MARLSELIKVKGDERGVTILVVVIVMIVLIFFAAFAIDIGHLFVVRNELQNAADAGALAGARVLYNDDATSVNTGANQVAYDAATANQSEKLSVEVNWPDGTDVQRGHWSFGLGNRPRGFYPNETDTEPPHLWDVTTIQLDEDIHFINAVRVKTRRESSPAASFFARIFGYASFILNAEAVAYLGFAGQLFPTEADQPIAICKQSLLDSENRFTCKVGRMINSGSSTTTHNSGGWTNFSQPCITASVPTVRPLVCASGNPGTVILGDGMGTTGGMEQTVYDNLMSCWRSQALPVDSNGNPTVPWKLTLPVIDCVGNNVSPCSTVLGAVEVNVLWITRTGFKNYVERGSGNADLPLSMAAIPIPDEPGYPLWSSPGGTPQQIWTSFVTNFHLTGLDGLPATAEDKAIYFLPDCAPHVPTGNSGGLDTGILAKYPALVQ